MKKYDVSTGVPKVFLNRVKQLVAYDNVSKGDFVDLCLIARELIDSGKTNTEVRGRIAYHITGIWLANKNIDNDDLLNAIGGQFGEWEIEGTFTMDKIDMKNWAKVKAWIAEAAEKYSNSDE